MSGHTNTTEIGGNVKNTVGYDYNADWFEHPISSIPTIIATFWGKWCQRRGKVMFLFSKKKLKAYLLIIPIIVVVLIILCLRQFPKNRVTVAQKAQIKRLNNPYISKEYSGWNGVMNLLSFGIIDSSNLKSGGKILKNFVDNGKTQLFSGTTRQATKKEVARLGVNAVKNGVKKAPKVVRKHVSQNIAGDSLSSAVISFFSSVFSLGITASWK